LKLLCLSFLDCVVHFWDDGDLFRELPLLPHHPIRNIFIIRGHEISMNLTDEELDYLKEIKKTDKEIIEERLKPIK